MYYLETPTERYPENSHCPVHNRQHNSHGWYVCLENPEVEEKCQIMADKANADETYTTTCVCGEKVFFVENDYPIMPGHIYSKDGIKEFRISGSCEYHFDSLFTEDEEF